MIDTLSNTVVATVDVSTAEPRGVAVNGAGTLVYVTHGCCSVLVLDTSSNTVTATVPIAAAPTEKLFGVAVNPAGTRAYASQVFSATVSVIDTSSNTETATVASAGSAGLVVSGDGARVYAADTATGSGQNVSVIDTATNSVSTTIPLGCAPYGLALNPAGTRLYATCPNGFALKVIDTGTDAVIATETLTNVPFGVSVTPDGSRVYVGANDDVDVIDAATNTLSTAIPIFGDTIAFGRFIGPDFPCGNGVPEPGEECDDGNANENDGCLSSCVTAPLPVPLLSPAGLVAYALALLGATALVLRRRAAAVTRAGGAG